MDSMMWLAGGVYELYGREDVCPSCAVGPRTGVIMLPCRNQNLPKRFEQRENVMGEWQQSLSSFWLFFTSNFFSFLFFISLCGWDFRWWTRWVISKRMAKYLVFAATLLMDFLNLFAWAQNNLFVRTV